jgi:hypothetical protein
MRHAAARVDRRLPRLPRVRHPGVCAVHRHGGLAGRPRGGQPAGHEQPGGQLGQPPGDPLGFRVPRPARPPAAGIAGGGRGSAGDCRRGGRPLRQLPAARRCRISTCRRSTDRCRASRRFPSCSSTGCTAREIVASTCSAGCRPRECGCARPCRRPSSTARSRAGFRATTSSCCTAATNGSGKACGWILMKTGGSACGPRPAAANCGSFSPRGSSTRTDSTPGAAACCRCWPPRCRGSPASMTSRSSGATGSRGRHGAPVPGDCCAGCSTRSSMWRCSATATGLAADGDAFSLRVKLEPARGSGPPPAPAPRQLEARLVPRQGVVELTGDCCDGRLLSLRLTDYHPLGSRNCEQDGDSCGSFVEVTR